MRAWLVILALLLVACGDDGGDGATPDAAPAVDAPSGAPDAPPGCPEPTAALPHEWRPIDATSAGAVSTTGGASKVTLVDATAGGPDGYPEQPYVYVDFVNGAAKVAITDVESYSSTEWDLGLKRYVIRLNGGDSGAAGVRAAVVTSASSLDDVTVSPPDGAFASDDWATDACDLVSGSLGEPLTALGNWYAYDVNTHRLTPHPWVFVVQLRDGSKIKLRIDSYYADPSNPMRGAYYRLQWAPL